MRLKYPTVEQYAIVAVSLCVSLITLLSMTKIWNEAFWKPSPDQELEEEAVPRMRAKVKTLVIPIMALAIITVSIGLAAGPLFSLATRAADQLLDPSEYINTVLGGAP